MTFKHEFASVLLLCWHADVVLSVFWKPPELRMLKDDVTPTPSTSQRSRNSAWVWGSAAFLLWKNTPHSQEFPSPAAVALMWRSARRSSGVGGKGINLTSASFQIQVDQKSPGRSQSESDSASNICAVSPVNRDWRCFSPCWIQFNVTSFITFVCLKLWGF